MTMSTTLAFLHHAAAFVLFAVLTVELVLTKHPLTPDSARSLLRMDAAFGLSALLLLVVGFARVIYTEKGFDYYLYNLPFLIKIGLFAAVGLLSVYPTLRFLGFRPVLRKGGEPALDATQRRRIRLIIHLELTLLLGIMLCAALAARGIGHLG